jgi:hypothetical protein
MGKYAKKPIYGRQGYEKGGGDTCDETNTLISLGNLVDAVLKAVEISYPTISIVSSNVGDLGIKMFVPPPIFVRLRWRAEHKEELFVPTRSQILELKQIYYDVGVDWNIDPLLRDIIEDNPL